ncbi:MAG: Phosphoribosylformylglycinamidine cyclo-ligase [Vampirovibrio sp.]|jgi:phosphoribosylformylglycinamidine cyclo-ligase|nr:Phosphoribosylformylglycinamidine cyclo-ligase [Vampirovibrio sp.]
MTTISSDEAYRQAGVDLKSAEAVVDIARHAAGQTSKPWLLGGIGGFSGAFEIPEGYRQPVLLCACDGVGTKLKLAFEANKHDTVGIDLVAMSVNDILVNGGEPLVFLDYLATQKIQGAQLQQILNGIAEGCQQANCALIGGETAEMPGFYAKDEYDLAGFCVGVAEKANLYPRKDQTKAGDVLIGLASSGLHSNGYSLVRKILFSDHQLDLSAHVPELGGTLADVLLTPTRIYVQSVLSILKQLPDAVHAMVHVTGGGFYDNIPRVLTPELSAEIDASSWQSPAIFPYLQTLGNLSNEAMWHTFNCGIGYILAVDAGQAQAVLDAFDRHTDEKAAIIGRLVPAQGQSKVIIQ